MTFYNVIDRTKVPPSWFWEPYILNGELNFFVGEDGVGKGRFARAMIARLAKGWPMPPYSPQDPTADRDVPQQTILITPEDNSYDTTIWQLRAEGCDDEESLGRIKDLRRVNRTSVTGNSARDLFSLPQDIGVLRQWVIKMGNVGLVVIDPLLATATTTVAFNQQVRMNILRPLQDLAEETGVAIVIFHHFNKGLKKDLSNLADKVNGSGGLKGAARCFNVIVRHPDDPELRVILSLKNNMTKADKIDLDDPDLMDGVEPVAYRIGGSGLDTHCLFKVPPPSLNDRERLLSFIVVTLQEAGMPLTDKAIAMQTQLPWTIVRQLVHEGVQLGIIQQTGKSYTSRAIEPSEPTSLLEPEPTSSLWAPPDRLLF